MIPVPVALVRNIKNVTAGNMLDNILNKYLTKRFLILFLIFLGVVLYLNTFFNEFLWDDEDFMQNIYIKDWRHIDKYFTQNLVSGSGRISNYWRPLLLLSFSLDWHIAKDQPFLYHFHNLFLHIFSAILLFLILDQLFKKRHFSFLISLIFLIHPLQTEAVTYISGRGDPLSVFFIFLTLFLFIKSFQPHFVKKWYFLSLFCFILSLLSKETAMVTPFLIMLILLSFQGKFFPENIISLSPKSRIGEIIFLSIKKITPFFIILAIFVSLRLTILNFQNILNFWPVQNIYTENISVRIFTFFKVLLIYLGLIFAPLNLHMERSVSVETSLFSLPVLAGFFVFLAMIILAIYDFLTSFFPSGLGLAVKKSLAQAERAGCPSEARTSEAERERSDLAGVGHSVFSCGKPKPPYFFFGIGWFFITLAPYSNVFIPIVAIIYEHWMYLPLIGIFICLANFFENIPEGKKEIFKKVFILFLIFYLSFFSIKTILRNREWRDPIVLYNQILKYSQSYRVYNNLGIAYSDIGEYEKAKENYQKAINFDPTFPQPEAYNNLGLLFFRQQQYDEAIFYYKKVLKVEENYLPALINLGNVYFRKKDWAKSGEYYLQYSKLAPDNFYPYFKLGEVSFYEGNCAQSLQYLEKAKEIAPAKDQVVQKSLSLLIEKAKVCPVEQL